MNPLTDMLSLQLYITAPYPCSYSEQRMSRSLLISQAHVIKTPIYSELIQQGFRRSGAVTYRPDCENCKACIPIRIPVALFKPGKTHRRILNRYAGLQINVNDLYFNEEHFQLYSDYQKKRHFGGGMDQDGVEQYEQFLLTSTVDTCLVEFYEKGCPGNEAKLKMVSVVDIVNDGLSAVYTFFDTQDPKASLGTYNILWLIQYAKAIGLPYVYLGYWVADCRKMAYKTNFKPFELLTSQGWEAGETIYKETPIK